MTPKALLEEINQLPVDERIRLVGDVWDQIAAKPDAVPVPESHRRELDHRLDHPSPEPSQSWDEVRQKLRQQR
jgi:putative addiction module component (TIGR02574 family)